MKNNNLQPLIKKQEQEVVVSKPAKPITGRRLYKGLTELERKKCEAIVAEQGI